MDKSEHYRLYQALGIVSRVLEGKEKISYEEFCKYGIKINGEVKFDGRQDQSKSDNNKKININK